jgi:hypothetical protein
MLPTLERLFELEDQASREVVGDLADDFSVKLVAGMADADNVDSIFHWIDTLIQNPNVEPAATYQWPRALQLWVRAELFTREAAIEHLKRWILQRSGESQDTFSGFCICEFVFGDAIDPSIVAALSSSLLGNCDPIDQRIDDASRGSLDRASLAMFYPLSVSFDPAGSN